MTYKVSAGHDNVPFSGAAVGSVGEYPRRGMRMSLAHSTIKTIKERRTSSALRSEAKGTMIRGTANLMTTLAKVDKKVRKVNTIFSELTFYSPGTVKIFSVLI